MNLKAELPNDVFIYTDPDAQNMARRMVFELEVDYTFKSKNLSTEFEETISEMTEFIMSHLGHRILVETEDRIARVLCMQVEERKLILIAFVNLKEELSPYETQPWAISVTPQRENIETYISIFLGFIFYD